MNYEQFCYYRPQSSLLLTIGDVKNTDSSIDEYTEDTVLNQKGFWKVVAIDVPEVDEFQYLELDSPVLDSQANVYTHRFIIKEMFEHDITMPDGNVITVDEQKQNYVNQQLTIKKYDLQDQITKKFGLDISGSIEFNDGGFLYTIKADEQSIRLMNFALGLPAKTHPELHIPVLGNPGHITMPNAKAKEAITNVLQKCYESFKTRCELINQLKATDTLTGLLEISKKLSEA